MKTDNDKTFRTKTGYCHVLPDKIVFTLDGEVEKALTAKTENHNSKWFKLIFGLILICLLYFVYDQYNKSIIDRNAFFIILVVAPIVYFLLSKTLQYKTITHIDRNKISKIKLYKSLGGLTYTKFIVYFESDNKKRLATDITLPDSNIHGKKDLDIAIKILTDEKLLNS